MSENLNNTNNTASINTTNNANNANNANGNELQTVDNVDTTDNIINAETNQISQANQSEEVPVMIHKQESQTAQININGENTLLNRFSYSPEDSYNKLTVREDDRENQVYRWNFKDEENIKANNLNSANNKKNKKFRKSFGLKLFAAIMSVMFLISVTASGVLLAQKLNNSQSGNPSAPVISNKNTGDDNNTAGSIEDTAILIPKDDNNATTLTIPEVIAKMKPSVVSVQTEVRVSNDIYGGFFGGGNGGTSIQQGVGTGFILTSDGYIATNYHVIDGADTNNITVLLSSGETYKAELIGGDEVADLAVIKIDAKNLPVAELGNSDATVEGEFVVAIGSPGGVEFANSNTFGIVSSANREVEVSEGKKMTLIQTDAAINPGNSGGPLVNTKGQVIGINTMKLSSNLYEGMGFSIPISIAAPTFNDIIANPGKINRAEGSSGNTIVDTSNVSFGITGATVTADEATQKNIPQGFKIATIDPDGACANTGLQSSDIITALDGRAVKSFDDLANLKKNYKPGDKAFVTVYRNGDELDFEITLKSK